VKIVGQPQLTLRIVELSEMSPPLWTWLVTHSSGARLRASRCYISQGEAEGDARRIFRLED